MTLQLPASLVGVPPGHYASIHEVFEAMGIVVPVKEHTSRARTHKASTTIKSWCRQEIHDE